MLCMTWFYCAWLGITVHDLVLLCMAWCCAPLGLTVHGLVYLCTLVVAVHDLVSETLRLVAQLLQAVHAL